jgi:hypothetical protein
MHRVQRARGAVPRPLKLIVRRQVMAATAFGGSSLRRWRFWLVLILVLEFCWFALLYPLVPRTLLAALVEFTLPLPFAGYIYLVFRALGWLLDSSFSASVKGILRISLAISVGLFGFLLVYGAQRMLSAGFGWGLSWF